MRIASIILGVFILGGFVLGFWFNGIVSRTNDSAPEQFVLRIEEGDGVRSVADKLADADFITTRWHWNLYIALTGQRSRILEGEYRLTGDMSIRQIANLVTSPPEAPEVTVKLLEGWSAENMADILERSDVISKDDFLEAVAVTDIQMLLPGADYTFLDDKPADRGLEGFLFPDTYRFFVPSTPEQVIAKLLDNFDQKLTEGLRESVEEQGRSLYEAVILASIVERELQTDKDRAKAADIFLRRIENGIALQSDATVNYVTGKSALRPTFADLEVDSPYNTYQHPGFPPGPIGNPGVSALRAAVNPEPNPYFYFLSGIDGKTHFAETLEGHNANREAYLE